MVRAIQNELAEEVTEQYSGDEPVGHETNRKSHSHSDGEPVTNRKLPYDEIAPRPLTWVNSYTGNTSNYLSTTTLCSTVL